MDSSVGPDSPNEVSDEQLMQVHSQPTTEVPLLNERIHNRSPDDIIETILSEGQRHKESQADTLPSSYKSWKKFKCRDLTNSEDTSIYPDLHKLIDVQRKYYHLIQFWLPDIQPAFISTRIIRDSRSVERHFARFFKRFMQADDLSEFFSNYRHNSEEDKVRRELKDQEPKISENTKQKDPGEPPRPQRKKAPSNRPVKFRGILQEKKKKQKKGSAGGGAGRGSKGVGTKTKKRTFLPAHFAPDRDLLGTNRAYTGGELPRHIHPNWPIQQRLKLEPTRPDGGGVRVLPSPEDMIADIRRLSDRFSKFTHEFINKVYNTHYADFNTAFMSLEAYEKDQETNNISDEGSQDEDNNDFENEADVDFADAENESDDDEWEEDDDEGLYHGRVDEQFAAPPSFYIPEQQLYERNYEEERKMLTSQVLGPITDKKSDYDTKHDPNNPATYNIDINEEPELGTLIQLFGSTHEIDFYRYILATYNDLADCVDCLTFVNSTTSELNAAPQLSNPTQSRVNTENEFLLLQAMCPDMSEILIREVLAVSDSVVEAATQLLDMSAEEAAVSAIVNVTNNSTPDTITAFTQDHTDVPPQTVYATNRVLKMKEPSHLQERRVSNSTLSAPSVSLVTLFNRLTKSSAEYRRELHDVEVERSNVLNTGTRVQLARNRNVTHKSAIMGGIAAYYEEKNRHYQNRLHNARLNVALIEIQRQMSENGNILDLHHFHVREALIAVPAYIDHWYRTQTQNSSRPSIPLQIITGKGLHSVDNRSRLFEKLLPVLREKGWIADGSKHDGKIVVKGRK